MKKTLLLLLISFTAFSQPDKDALLAKDHAEVIEKFKLMNYLDSIAMSYYTTLKIRNKAEDDKTFYRFYIDNIVKNNPVVSLQVPDFLGYTGYEAPMTWKQFGERVVSKNLETLVAITKKYGYPGHERMKPYTGTAKFTSPATYVTRGIKYDKELKSLLKREHKLGNMSDSEYDFLKFILERKTELTPHDLKQLEEKGIIMQPGRN